MWTTTTKNSNEKRNIYKDITDGLEGRRRLLSRT